MREELLNRAQEALALARSVGADDAWAVASRVRSVEFTQRDDRPERVQENTSRSLHLALYVRGRYSSHSTTDLDSNRLGDFVRQAVAMTLSLEVDPHRQLPDPSLFANRAEVDLDLIDPGSIQLDNQTRQEWCSEMVQTARPHTRTISAFASASNLHALSASVSTNGFVGTSEGTRTSLGAQVTLQDDDERRPEDGMWVSARHRESLPAPGQIGSMALERALSRLGSRAGATRRTTLVVESRAARRLISHLISPATARAIHQGRSFYSQFPNQPQLSPLMSLTDDPLRVRGLRSRLYDGEGISVRPMPIIGGGVAQNLYVDTYYGRKADLRPTTGSSSNLVMELGQHGLEELMDQVREGVLVTSWLGGNSDPTSGDFSFGFRGHLIENGVTTRPLSEMNVTGNLPILFGRLSAVGNDPWPYSTDVIPTLVFDDVQLSGVRA